MQPQCRMFGPVINTCRPGCVSAMLCCVVCGVSAMLCCVSAVLCSMWCIGNVVLCIRLVLCVGWVVYQSGCVVCRLCCVSAMLCFV